MDNYHSPWLGGITGTEAGEETLLGGDGRRLQTQRILVVKAAIAYKAAYVPIAGTIIVITPISQGGTQDEIEWMKVIRTCTDVESGEVFADDCRECPR